MPLRGWNQVRSVSRVTSRNDAGNSSIVFRFCSLFHPLCTCVYNQGCHQIHRCGWLGYLECTSTLFFWHYDFLMYVERSHLQERRNKIQRFQPYNWYQLTIFTCFYKHQTSGHFFLHWPSWYHDEGFATTTLTAVAAMTRRRSISKGYWLVPPKGHLCFSSPASSGQTKVALCRNKGMPFAKEMLVRRDNIHLSSC